MDCQVALNILDSVFPSEDPNRHPDYQEAFTHIEECKECVELWNARKHFDRQVAKTMADIPVPENLKSKLLSQTGQKTDSVTVTQEVVKRNSFRYFKHITATLTLCFIFGASFYFWNNSPSIESSNSLVTIQANVPDSLTKLDIFDGSFEPVLPDKGWQDQAFTYASTPKGISSTQEGQHDRAIFGFVLNVQNQNPIQGLLVVYSKSDVKNLPDRIAFDSSAVKYLNRGNSKFASVSWVSGDQVYVCYVYAGESNNNNSDGLNAIESIERVVNLPTV